jgi:septation ring formation regulator EzrA
MEDKLFRELYNFVDDVNTLLSNLSAENVEMAGNAGVMDAIDKLYNIVEREGMAKRENS